MISDMHFMHPGLLWLLLLIVPLTVWHVLKDRKSDPTLRLPTTQAFDNMGVMCSSPSRCWLSHAW